MEHVLKYRTLTEFLGHDPYLHETYTFDGFQYRVEGFYGDDVMVLEWEITL